VKQWKVREGNIGRTAFMVGSMGNFTKLLYPCWYDISSCGSKLLL
jgi:hypothetical protein